MSGRYNYETFRTLFSKGDDFKPLYTDMINTLFRKEFGKLDRWGYVKGRECVTYENGNRHPFNTINTHSSIAAKLCNWYCKNFEFEGTGIEDNQYYGRNIHRLGMFLRDNFKLIFTDEIKNHYHEILLLDCNHSWSYGLITQIGVIMCLYEIFPESQIEFTVETGDLDDMYGKDFTMTDHGVLYSNQVKTGKATKNGDTFEIWGSQNDLKYSVDRYIYGKVEDNEVTMIMFKNDIEVLNTLKVNRIIKVPESLVIVSPYKSQNLLPQLIKRFIDICVRELQFVNFKNGTDGTITDIGKDGWEVILPDLKNKEQVDDFSKSLIKMMKIYEPIGDLK